MSDYQFNPNVEQWKEIPGFPGYEVSDHGRVRSFWRPAQPNTGYKWKLVSDPQRVLCPGMSRGYLRVYLIQNGKQKTMRVHRLVLLAFVGPCPPQHESRHFDGCRTRNRIDNLAWSTHQKNLQDRKNHGTDPIGERCGRAKLTESQVKHIRSAPHCNCAALARQFKVDPSTIRTIRKGKSWKYLL